MLHHIEVAQTDRGSSATVFQSPKADDGIVACDAQHANLTTLIRNQSRSALAVPALTSAVPFLAPAVGLSDPVLHFSSETSARFCLAMRTVLELTLPSQQFSNTLSPPSSSARQGTRSPQGSARSGSTVLPTSVVEALVCHWPDSSGKYLTSDSDVDTRGT